MGCKHCGTMSPRSCSNCIDFKLFQKAVTVRFWFQSSVAGEAFANKIRSYGANFIHLGSSFALLSNAKYQIFAGRVLLVLDKTTADADLTNIILTAQDSGCHIGELLVGDEWETIKPVIRETHHEKCKREKELSE